MPLTFKALYILKYLRYNMVLDSASLQEAGKMIPESTLKVLRDYFAQRDDITAAYLFGSTVKNKERKGSDLDLAILFKGESSAYARFQAKLQIANDLETEVKADLDVVDLRSADLFFVHQVMKNKLLLFEREVNDRVSFEVKYRKRFFDLMPLYKEYHHQSRKRLEGR
jgi:predicted nucleotidyltransferase